MPDTLPSVADTRAVILDAIEGPFESERVPVELAVDRVLAEDVRARGDVPPFANSAMDGYAVSAAPSGIRLRVTGESKAGSPYPGTLGAGEAIRISTGAAVPDGANAVIRQEDVNVLGETIETLADVSTAENVRAAGSDVRAGALVAATGSPVSPTALGVLIGAGAATVAVARRPRVSVICTGDELRAPGMELGPGEIHNSNGPMLAALATRCGAAVDPVVNVRDDREVIESALQQALETCEVLILTGGMSVGPHDHVRPALASIGVRQHLWGVALQPGKPTYFGSRGKQLVFGLPGNPVSAVVTFTLFAWPALATLQGGETFASFEASAVLAEGIRRRRERERAVTVRLALGAQATVATPTGPQESHLVSSLFGADALAIIPKGDGELPAGSIVTLERLIR
jgi:molybdopterin molybdotransferase